MESEFRYYEDKYCPVCNAEIPTIIVADIAERDDSYKSKGGDFEVLCSDCIEFKNSGYITFIEVQEFGRGPERTGRYIRLTRSLCEFVFGNNCRQFILVSSEMFETISKQVGIGINLIRGFK